MYDPLFCILPPHIFQEIAKNGSEKDREAALEILATDHIHRIRRATFTAMGGLKLPPPKLPSPRISVVHRLIYDCKHTMHLPGTLVRSEGQPPTTDKSANNAYDHLGETFAFYFSVYHRYSIDNKGMPLHACVHYGTKYDNAFWDGSEMVFGDGDSVYFNDFTIPLDVTGHELTHGVTAHEANLVYHDQPGALNESISDVFGILVKQYKLKQTAAQADWIIGAGLFTSKVNGVGIRSMKAPGTAYNDPILGKDPQPADMTKFVQGGDVHVNSGIPNHAFYLVASAIGGYAWQKAGLIWYETLRDHNLSSTADFTTFANLTIQHAGIRFGIKSPEQKAVISAWEQVKVPIMPLMGVEEVMEEVAMAV